MVSETQQRILKSKWLDAKAPALQFSGGKDSLACLYLLEPIWHKLTVLYSNAGDPFPETLSLIESVRPKVRALEISYGKSQMDLPAVDVLPIRSTPLGMLLEPDGKQVRLQDRYSCCTRNLWKPMDDLVGQLDIDLLIRGQRDDEELRVPLQDGSKDAHGIPIWFPIKDWTRKDVFAYLSERGVPLPRFYELMDCSVDCMTCTAYLKDTRGKVQYLRKYHPQASKRYEQRLSLVASAMKPDIDELTKTLVEING